MLKPKCRNRSVVPILAAMLLGVWNATVSAQEGPSIDSELAQLEAIPLGAALTPPDQAERWELKVETEKRWNLYAGVDVVSMYMSRGLIYSDVFSIQPWTEFDVTLNPGGDGPGPIGEISWFIGNWNSIHDSDEIVGAVRTGNLKPIEEWYEADVYTGVRLDLWDHLQVSFRFNWYMSPSDSFNQLQELDLRLSYDDSGFWSEQLGWDGFALTPSLRIAKETRDSGGPEQWYFQPSITPSYTFTNLPRKVTLKMPIILGFGADGQYRETGSGKERHFGFVQTGLGIDFPLNEAGTLVLSGSFDVVWLASEKLTTDYGRDERVRESLLNQLQSAVTTVQQAQQGGRGTFAIPEIPTPPDRPAINQDRVEYVGRIGISYRF